MENALRLEAGRRSAAYARIGATLVVFLAALLGPMAPAPAAAKESYRSDDWITECDSAPGKGAPDCAITVPFADGEGAGRGSFALVVALGSGEVGIVGQPVPLRARLQVDGNPPVECRQPRYCLFPKEESLAVVNQLDAGSLVLIEVVTAKKTFEFSLTPKGFRAGMDQIEAWGYGSAGE